LNMVLDPCLAHHENLFSSSQEVNVCVGVGQRSGERAPTWRIGVRVMKVGHDLSAGWGRGGEEGKEEKGKREQGQSKVSPRKRGTRLEDCGR